MEKDKFDQIFDEAFDEAAKNLTTPDPTASWNRIEIRLKRRSKRRIWLHILPYLVASFILGAALFGTPTSTKAFSPIFQHIKSFKNDVVSFIFGSLDTTNTTPKTAPPPDVSSETSGGLDVAVGQLIEQHYSSWTEVTQQNVFPPVAIEYIPDGFKQSDIILFFKPTQETAIKAVLLFTNEANERFILTMNLLGRNETITSNNDTTNGTLETIPIHDSEAYLFITADNRKILEYLYTNLHISISGSLSKEDLIKIAENIKKRGG